MALDVRILIPERLFAAGGAVPADRPTTWIEPGLGGYLSVPSYVLRDGNTAIIMDGGLAIHRNQLSEGLGSLLAHCETRAFIMTRREPDCIINLPWLIDKFEVNPVYCGGILSPLDFFEQFEQKAAEANISAIANSDITWLQPGKAVRIGSFRFQAMRAQLSVLPKSHFFESTTRTLFGSDSWGFLTQDTSGVPDVVDRIDRRLSRDRVTEYLRHKFDWLLAADTSAVEEELQTLQDLAPDRICASYGCVIEGREVARHLIKETIAAVRLLAKEPIADRLRGIRHERIRQALA